MLQCCQRVHHREADAAAFPGYLSLPTYAGCSTWTWKGSHAFSWRCTLCAGLGNCKPNYGGGPGGAREACEPVTRRIQVVPASVRRNTTAKFHSKQLFCNCNRTEAEQGSDTKAKSINLILTISCWNSSEHQRAAQTPQIICCQWTHAF